MNQIFRASDKIFQKNLIQKEILNQLLSDSLMISSAMELKINMLDKWIHLSLKKKIKHITNIFVDK